MVAGETYSEWLRRQMDDRQVTTRELARRLNPDDPEIARRAVRRYLAGMVPIERTRDRIAHALGIRETGPRAVADDSEDD